MKTREEKEGEGLITPHTPVAILRQKNFDQIIVTTGELCRPKEKKISLGEPLETFQLLSSGSGSVHTLISEGTPFKSLVVIWIFNRQ